MDATIRLLADLVAIDSVNPSLVSGGAGERVIAGRIADELRSAGLDVEVAEAAPGRPNVVGILNGRSMGRSLMLCGHMDTVGVAGMAAPFDPVIRDGRLYGRGAQDMKGGLAALIGAACRLARDGGVTAGNVILAAVADEEYASIGAETLVTRWKADAAIVAEPTDMVIATGHKGFSWIEVAAEGVAAHGSRPADGRDAILRMGRVLARLENLGREIQARKPHPILGTASLHASLISGGREWSTYPEKCSLQMERRTVIGEDPSVAMQEVESILKSLRAEDPEFRAAARAVFDRPPYELPAGHFLLPGLVRAARKAGIATRTGGVSFWTDAAILGHAGIPSLIFGPGGAGLHSVEEYVNLNDVLACRDAVAEAARTVCCRTA
jgi:acetylornithine deacetylase